MNECREKTIGFCLRISNVVLCFVFESCVWFQENKKEMKDNIFFEYLK